MTDKKPNKKTYKETHGTTRVGDFLRELGKPETLKAVLKAASSAVTGDVSGVIDALTGSTELSEAETLLAIKEVERDMVEEQEITKRWQADTNSQSWLPSNVRPLVLLYLVLFTTVVAVLDSAKVLDVKEHWVTLLTSLLLTTIGAYFGLREVGKYVQKKYK